MFLDVFLGVFSVSGMFDVLNVLGVLSALSCVGHFWLVGRFACFERFFFLIIIYRRWAVLGNLVLDDLGVFGPTSWASTSARPCPQT